MCVITFPDGEHCDYACSVTTYSYCFPSIWRVIIVKKWTGKDALFLQYTLKVRLLEEKAVSPYHPMVSLLANHLRLTV